MSDLFDNDGYPTEETLEKISTWEVTNKNVTEFIRFCWSAWKYHDCVWHRKNGWTFVTLGWSGNEDIIRAMMKNRIFWLMFWRASFVGGKYVFEDRHG